IRNGVLECWSNGVMKGFNFVVAKGDCLHKECQRRKDSDSMKTKMAIKLVLLAVLIVAIAYWLRGHDILTGVALSLLLLVAVAKVVAAIIVHRRGGGPRSGGGAESSGRPVPRPPGGR